MKRNIKSKLLTVLLAVAMLIGIMPNVVHADRNDAYLTIGGVDYYIREGEIKYWDVDEERDIDWEDTDNVKLSIDDTTFTVTLTNYSDVNMLDFDNYTFTDFNIVLNGENTITIDESKVKETGISVADIDFNISGTGSLTINNNSTYGPGISIYNGKLTINSGTLIINSKKLGVSVREGDIDILGGIVNIISEESDGISINKGILNIDSGKLNITCDNTGIYVDVTGITLGSGAVNIDGGSVTVNSTNGIGIHCFSDDGTELKLETLTIGEDITKVDIAGAGGEEYPAISPIVINAIAGTGYKNTSDTTGTPIEISESGQDLTSYQRVVFAGVEDKYECYEGNNQSWTKGSSSDLAITFKRTVKDETTYNNFMYIEVYGSKVDKENYTKASGSVIITLKSSYLETLPEGERTLTAYFEGGSATAKFTIAKKASPTPSYVAPKTGIE